MANRIKMKVISSALLMILILSACGQKRALYLPEKPVTNTTTADSEALPEPATQEIN